MGWRSLGTPGRLGVMTDTTASQSVLVLGPDEGEEIIARGNRLLLKAVSPRVTLVDYVAPAGFPGPPLHVHPGFDELFFVLDGELTFQIRGKLKTVAAGEWLLAPRGVPHTFANHGDLPARALIAVTPAGFERYFRLVNAELTGTEPPADAFGPRPATEHVGPPIPRSRRR
jgi:mannose-6-phosphate isomerase-like protein (cupin superfamily)